MQRCGVCILLILAFCCLGLPPAKADVFKLDDGVELEGTIVRELGDLVSIKTTDGKVVTLDRSRIVSTRKTRTKFDEYQERVDGVGRSAGAQLELARWCARSGLEQQARIHFKSVIELEPNHEEARTALGHVWIAGDWYIEGSPEAVARLKELERPLERAPKAIPEDFRPPKVSDDPEPRSGPVAANAVQLRLSESLGKEEPEQPFARHEIRTLLKSMDPAMSLGPDIKQDTELVDGWFLDVKIRVYFLKTTKYYGKIPMENLFQGEAEAVLYRIEGGRKSEMERVPKVTVPFGATVKVEKDAAYQFAYYTTCRTLSAKMSRRPFFKNRGVQPLPYPEEVEN